MLDGIQNEKQAYHAKKVIETSEGNIVNMTMHFTAYDLADAQRFLSDHNYDGYELITDATSD